MERCPLWQGEHSRHRRHVPEQEKDDQRQKKDFDAFGAHGIHLNLFLSVNANLWIAEQDVARKRLESKEMRRVG